MVGKWVLMAFFWASAHAPFPPADKAMTETFDSRIECVTHQHLVADTIVKRWPGSKIGTVCLPEDDYANKTPLDNIKNISVVSNIKDWE